MHFSRLALSLSAVLITAAAHAQQRPDLAGQKAAMDKLGFLAGTWTGEATISAGQGKQINIKQTEQVTFKLDGLALLIEGTGRDDSGKVVFNALAVVSFDPQTGNYRIRAWNSGNFVDTEFKVLEKGFEWGFQRGPVTVQNRMTVDDKGRWSEESEATLNGGQKVHSVRMVLSRTAKDVKLDG
jgi:hypothetical protein